ncbi:EpsG family protein [Vibrio fluvialis]|uniref:EpsG family protein n=1 Tax=Vibrio fluvialis TaxID=676 RepID=UPI003B58A978
MYFIFFLALSIYFGSRYEVGVDWKNYISAFEFYNYNRGGFSLEIGYKYLNLLSYELGYNIQFVIYVTMFIVFGVSFYSLSKLHLNAFLFLAITFPYFIVMGALNYTRQGVAFSFFLLSIYYLFTRRKIAFVISILIGCTFHLSLILFLPLFLNKIKTKYLFLLLIVFVLFFVYLINYQYSMYLDADFESKGLILRLVFVILSSFFIFANRKIVYMKDIEERRVFIFSLYSPLFIIIMSLLSTTMADRISYYFILMSTICCLFISKDKSCVRYRRSIPMVLFFCSFSVFIIWSIYSSYVPYYIFNSILFSEVF